MREREKPFFFHHELNKEKIVVTQNISVNNDSGYLLWSFKMVSQMEQILMLDMIMKSALD